VEEREGLLLTCFWEGRQLAPKVVIWEIFSEECSCFESFSSELGSLSKRPSYVLLAPWISLRISQEESEKRFLRLSKLKS